MNKEQHNFGAFTAAPGSLSKRWSRFWMRFSGLTSFGKMATRLAAWPAPPHYSREYLAVFHRQGYISATAVIHHSQLYYGTRLFVDDRCMIYQNREGKSVRFGNSVRIYRDVIIETGSGGSVEIGDYSSIHPRCQMNAYMEPIQIGNQVMIAANCAFYSYDHGISGKEPIHKQPLQSRGPIIIGDGAWLGTGVTVLSGVVIGSGAVIGAGSVVTKDIPANAIAVGNPARVLKLRSKEV